MRSIEVYLQPLMSRDTLAVQCSAKQCIGYAVNRQTHSHSQAQNTNAFGATVAFFAAHLAAALAADFAAVVATFVAADLLFGAMA